MLSWCIPSIRFSLPGRVAVIKTKNLQHENHFPTIVVEKLVVPFGTFKHGGAKGLAR
jgi:hypothetical protein